MTTKNVRASPRQPKSKNREIVPISPATCLTWKRARRDCRDVSRLSLRKTSIALEVTTLKGEEILEVTVRGIKTAQPGMTKGRTSEDAPFWSEKALMNIQQIISNRGLDSSQTQRPIIARWRNSRRAPEKPLTTTPSRLRRTSAMPPLCSSTPRVKMEQPSAKSNRRRLGLRAKETSSVWAVM